MGRNHAQSDQGTYFLEILLKRDFISRPVWHVNNSRVARFRWRRLQSSMCTRVHSFNNNPICMHVNAHVHTYAYTCSFWPFTTRGYFEDSVYWEELIKTCCDTSRVAGRDFNLQQDFEEILRYVRTTCNQVCENSQLLEMCSSLFICIWSASSI